MTDHLQALPADHPIRRLPDDYRLFELVCAQRAAQPRQEELPLLRWAYDTARAERIPTECVSKVLTLVRRLEREARR